MIIFPAPRRCSGYSRGEECKFSLLLDVGESEVWGGGLVTISHTCVNTDNIVTECGNTDNQVTFIGFLICCDCVVMTLCLLVDGKETVLMNKTFSD